MQSVRQWRPSPSFDLLTVPSSAKLNFGRKGVQDETVVDDDQLLENEDGVIKQEVCQGYGSDSEESATADHNGSYSRASSVVDGNDTLATSVHNPASQVSDDEVESSSESRKKDRRKWPEQEDTAMPSSAEASTSHKHKKRRSTSSEVPSSAADSSLGGIGDATAELRNADTSRNYEALDATGVTTKHKKRKKKLKIEQKDSEPHVVAPQSNLHTPTPKERKNSKGTGENSYEDAPVEAERKERKTQKKSKKSKKSKEKAGPDGHQVPPDSQESKSYDENKRHRHKDSITSVTPDIHIKSEPLTEHTVHTKKHKTGEDHDEVRTESLETPETSSRKKQDTKKRKDKDNVGDVLLASIKEDEYTDMQSKKSKKRKDKDNVGDVSLASIKEEEYTDMQSKKSKKRKDKDNVGDVSLASIKEEEYTDMQSKKSKKRKDKDNVGDVSLALIKEEEYTDMQSKKSKKRKDKDNVDDVSPASIKKEESQVMQGKKSKKRKVFEQDTHMDSTATERGDSSQDHRHHKKRKKHS